MAARRPRTPRLQKALEPGSQDDLRPAHRVVSGEHRPRPSPPPKFVLGEILSVWTTSIMIQTL